jgi:hypothetical protein
MAVIQGRTREQLRHSVGYNLGAMRTSAATAEHATPLLNIVDNTLVSGGNDRFNGRWLVLQDAGTANDGLIRRITDSSVSSNVYTLTFAPAAAAAVTTGDTYEIWDDRFPPQRINDFINQSIIDATGHAYTVKEDISLHGDGTTSRLDIPSSLQMLQRVEYRSQVSSTVIHRCNETFTEATVPGTFVQSLDTQNRKQGNSSLQLTITSGTNDQFVSVAITSKDLSKYDTIEMWVRSTVGTSAGDLRLLLDNTAASASPVETLPIPALTANTWTFVRMALAAPYLDTAIISVGFQYHDNSIGNCVINIDDIVAVQADTAVWRPLDRRAWHIDRQQRDLILHDDGRSALGYRLVKLIGGAKPALLTSDSATNEIDDQYVINRTTGMALASAGGGQATDPDSSAQRAAFWFGMAEQSKRSFAMLVDVRMAE